MFSPLKKKRKDSKLSVDNETLDTLFFVQFPLINVFFVFMKDEKIQYVESLYP